MDITLDITECFNGTVNNEWFHETLENIVFFMDFKDKLNDVLEFELMNFGLNLEDFMLEEFAKHSPYFDDIIEFSKIDRFPSIIIYGKAKFKITDVKGMEIKYIPKVYNNPDDLYFGNWDYKLKKGDTYFDVGGYLPTSPYWASCRIIAGLDTKATITFSSDEYVIDDITVEVQRDAFSRNVFDFEKNYVEEIPKYATKIPGKMFNWDFYCKHFKTHFEGEEVFTTIRQHNTVVVDEE